MTDRLSGDLRIDSTNPLNHVTFTELEHHVRQRAIWSSKPGCSQCHAQSDHRIHREVLKRCSAPHSRFFRCVLAAAAQQIGQNAPAGGNSPSTFSTSSQLVIETVNVKDKNGKPVEGLTAKDFTVTEDGAEQIIRLFEFQKVPETARRRASNCFRASRLSQKLPETQITAEKPGDIRYQDRRLLVLYFDMTAMPPPDQLRAITAAEKFVRTRDDAGRSHGADEI